MARRQRLKEADEGREEEGREDQWGVGERLVAAVPGLGQRWYEYKKWSLMAGSAIGLPRSRLCNSNCLSLIGAPHSAVQMRRFFVVPRLSNDHSLALITMTCKQAALFTRSEFAGNGE